MAAVNSHDKAIALTRGAEFHCHIDCIWYSQPGDWKNGSWVLFLYAKTLEVMEGLEAWFLNERVGREVYSVG